MKYTETGFRPLYHCFAVFPLTPAIRSAIRDFPGEKEADGVLVYGYYDQQCGLTLEELGCARKKENRWQFADGRELVRSVIRIDAVKDDDFGVFPDEDGRLAKRYADRLEVVKAYDAPEAVEKSRTFAFLDDARHPEYIDDIQVVFAKEGLTPERCWARIIDLSERRIWAKLLNEPDQDFGVHEGEDFSFFVHRDEKTGKVTCHAQFSPLKKMKPEDFADGKLLQDAIRNYHEHSEGDALFELLQVLRDCDVWIPCTAALGEEDTKAFLDMIREAGDDLESLKGKNLCNSGKIRIIPDILENDGKKFFPVFAAEEDMGEYGEGFSKIQQSFMNVISMARNSSEKQEKLTGIVINAFTEPFILPEELYDAVEKMVSRVE